ncbi:TPA: stress response small protein YobI, partial [Escherichia coli]|nr:stress response small protein YobI [Escherichia coli]
NFFAEYVIFKYLLPI